MTIKQLINYLKLNFDCIGKQKAVEFLTKYTYCDIDTALKVYSLCDY